MLPDERVQLCSRQIFQVQLLLSNGDVTVQGQHRDGKCPGKVIGREACGFLVSFADPIQHLLVNLC